jgi:hypothetical protein
MSEMVRRVALAMMAVKASLPGGQLEGREVPVLTLDPDFDDLPRDSSEGTEDDDITQEAVLRLARAAIEAMREPSQTMFDALQGYALCAGYLKEGWEAAINVALIDK